MSRSHIHFDVLLHVAEDSKPCRKNPTSISQYLYREEVNETHTMDNMTTHGRFSEETISTASDVFPEPELPAIPIILVFAHGGL